MVLVNEEKTGDDLSLTNGVKNRTLALAQADAQSTGMDIHMNGVYLHQGAGKDYTHSGGTVTFLNEVFDSQIISISYLTDTSTSDTGNLCTQAQVKLVAYGRTTGIDVAASDLIDAIDNAETEIFEDYGYAKRVRFSVLNSRTQYEFRPTRLKTYSVERVFVNSPNIAPNNQPNRNLVNSGSYTADLSANKITISSGLAGSWNGSWLEVDFWPLSWNKLAKNKAALDLLDADMAAMNPGDGNVDNPRVSRIAKRIRRIERQIQPVVAVGSFENSDYDVRERSVLYQRRFNQTA